MRQVESNAESLAKENGPGYEANMEPCPRMGLYFLYAATMLTITSKSGMGVIPIGKQRTTDFLCCLAHKRSVCSMKSSSSAWVGYG